MDDSTSYFDQRRKEIHLGDGVSLPRIRKRQRISKNTREILEKAFATNPYHRNMDIEKLANLSGEKPHRIKTWFINRRVKEKQIKQKKSNQMYPGKGDEPLQTLDMNCSMPSEVSIRQTDDQNAHINRHTCFHPKPDVIEEHKTFEHYRIRAEKDSLRMILSKHPLNVVISDKDFRLMYNPGKIYTEVINVDDNVIQDFEYHEMLRTGQLVTSEDED